MGRGLETFWAPVSSDKQSSFDSSMTGADPRRENYSQASFDPQAGRVLRRGEDANAGVGSGGLKRVGTGLPEIHR